MEETCFLWDLMGSSTYLPFAKRSYATAPGDDWSASSALTPLAPVAKVNVTKILSVRKRTYAGASRFVARNGLGERARTKRGKPLTDLHELLTH